MNDNILKVKSELWRIYRSSELTKIERYELVIKQKEQLSEIELKLLIKELHRDYTLCDRLKDLVDVITAFFSGITILLTILGVFYKGIGTDTVQFGILLFYVGVYVLFGIMSIWGIHWHRSRKLNRIQYILDILEEK